MKQNRADIKRSDLQTDMAGHANANIKIAGTNLKPWDMDYVASATVHLYKRSGSANFAFINQLVGFTQVEEGQADVALKELRRALMAAYGREDKRRSDTKDELL
jgi:hypothetical protein